LCPRNSFYSYYNTGKLAQIASVNANPMGGNDTVTSSYKYDIDGNRTFEGYALSGNYYYGDEWGNYYPFAYGTTYQSATATWDALNRMIAINDTVSATPMSAFYEYDAAGNVRRMASTHRTLDQQGTISSASTTEDYWYKYDSMNRVVVSRGLFSGARGSAITGTQYLIDGD